MADRKLNYVISITKSDSKAVVQTLAELKKIRKATQDANGAISSIGTGNSSASSNKINKILDDARKLNQEFNKAGISGSAAQSQFQKLSNILTEMGKASGMSDENLKRLKSELNDLSGSSQATTEIQKELEASLKETDKVLKQSANTEETLIASRRNAKEAADIQHQSTIKNMGLTAEETQEIVENTNRLRENEVARRKLTEVKIPANSIPKDTAKAVGTSAKASKESKVSDTRASLTKEVIAAEKELNSILVKNTSEKEKQKAIINDILAAVKETEAVKKTASTASRVTSTASSTTSSTGSSRGGASGGIGGGTGGSSNKREVDEYVKQAEKKVAAIRTILAAEEVLDSKLKEINADMVRLFSNKTGSEKERLAQFRKLSASLERSAKEHRLNKAASEAYIKTIRKEEVDLDKLGVNITQLEAIFSKNAITLTENANIAEIAARKYIELSTAGKAVSDVFKNASKSGAGNRSAIGKLNSDANQAISSLEKVNKQIADLDARKKSLGNAGTFIKSETTGERLKVEEQVNEAERKQTEIGKTVELIQREVLKAKTNQIGKEKILQDILNKNLLLERKSVELEKINDSDSGAITKKVSEMTALRSSMEGLQKENEKFSASYKKIQSNITGLNKKLRTQKAEFKDSFSESSAAIKNVENSYKQLSKTVTKEATAIGVVARKNLQLATSNVSTQTNANSRLTKTLGERKLVVKKIADAYVNYNNIVKKMDVYRLEGHGLSTLKAKKQELIESANKLRLLGDLQDKLLQKELASTKALRAQNELTRIYQYRSAASSAASKLGEKIKEAGPSNVSVGDKKALEVANGLIKRSNRELIAQKKIVKDLRAEESRYSDQIVNAQKRVNESTRAGTAAHRNAESVRAAEHEQIVKQQNEQRRLIEANKKASMGFVDRVASGYGKVISTLAQYFSASMLILTVIRKIKEVFISIIEVSDRTARAFAVSRSAVMLLEDRFVALGEAIMDTSARMGRSIEQVSEVMFQFGSAGLTAEESISALNSTMNLITATDAEASTTTKTVAATYRLMGDSIDVAGGKAAKFARISDILANTYRNNQVELDELNQSMKFALPVAKQLGLSLEEVTGILAHLHNNMIRGGEAGRSLRSIFSKMTTGMHEFSKAFDIAIDPNKPLDFLDILKQVNARMREGSLTASDVERVFKRFGLRGANSFQILTSKFKELSSTIENQKFESVGSAERQAKERIASLGGQIKILGEVSSKVAREAFEPLAYALITVVKALTKMFQVIDNNKSLQLLAKVMTSILGIMAAVTAVKVVMAIRAKAHEVSVIAETLAQKGLNKVESESVQVNNSLALSEERAAGAAQVKNDVTAEELAIIDAKNTKQQESIAVIEASIAQEELKAASLQHSTGAQLDSIAAETAGVAAQNNYTTSTRSAMAAEINKAAADRAGASASSLKVAAIESEVSATQASINATRVKTISDAESVNASRSQVEASTLSAAAIAEETSALEANSLATDLNAVSKEAQAAADGEAALATKALTTAAEANAVAQGISATATLSSNLAVVAASSGLSTMAKVGLNLKSIMFAVGNAFKNAGKWLVGLLAPIGAITLDLAITIGVILAAVAALGLLAYAIYQYIYKEDIAHKKRLQAIDDYAELHSEREKQISGIEDEANKIDKLVKAYDEGRTSAESMRQAINKAVENNSDFVVAAVSAMNSGKSDRERASIFAKQLKDLADRKKAADDAENKALRGDRSKSFDYDIKKMQEYVVKYKKEVYELAKNNKLRESLGDNPKENTHLKDVFKKRIDSEKQKIVELRKSASELQKEFNKIASTDVEFVSAGKGFEQLKTFNKLAGELNFVTANINEAKDAMISLYNSAKNFKDLDLKFESKADFGSTVFRGQNAVNTAMTVELNVVVDPESIKKFNKKMYDLAVDVERIWRAKKPKFVVDNISMNLDKFTQDADRLMVLAETYKRELSRSFSDMHVAFNIDPKNLQGMLEGLKELRDSSKDLNGGNKDYLDSLMKISEYQYKIVEQNISQFDTEGKSKVEAASLNDKKKIYLSYMKNILGMSKKVNLEDMNQAKFTEWASKNQDKLLVSAKALALALNKSNSIVENISRMNIKFDQAMLEKGLISLNKTKDVSMEIEAISHKLYILEQRKTAMISDETKEFFGIVTAREKELEMSLASSHHEREASNQAKEYYEIKKRTLTQLIALAKANKKYLEIEKSLADQSNKRIVLKEKLYNFGKEQSQQALVAARTAKKEQATMENFVGQAARYNKELAKRAKYDASAAAELKKNQESAQTSQLRRAKLDALIYEQKMKYIRAMINQEKTENNLLSKMKEEESLGGKRFDIQRKISNNALEYKRSSYEILRIEKLKFDAETKNDEIQKSLTKEAKRANFSLKDNYFLNAKNLGAIIKQIRPQIKLLNNSRSLSKNQEKRLKSLKSYYSLIKKMFNESVKQKNNQVRMEHELTKAQYERNKAIAEQVRLQGEGFDLLFKQKEAVIGIAESYYALLDAENSSRDVSSAVAEQARKELVFRNRLVVAQQQLAVEYAKNKAMAEQANGTAISSEQIIKTAGAALKVNTLYMKRYTELQAMRNELELKQIESLAKKRDMWKKTLGYMNKEAEKLKGTLSEILNEDAKDNVFSRLFYDIKSGLGLSKDAGKSISKILKDIREGTVSASEVMYGHNETTKKVMLQYEKMGKLERANRKAQEQLNDSLRAFNTNKFEKAMDPKNLNIPAAQEALQNLLGLTDSFNIKNGGPDFKKTAKNLGEYQNKLEQLQRVESSGVDDLNKKVEDLDQKRLSIVEQTAKSLAQLSDNLSGISGNAVKNLSDFESVLKSMLSDFDGNEIKLKLSVDDSAINKSLEELSKKFEKITGYAGGAAVSSYKVQKSSPEANATKDQADQIKKDTQLLTKNLSRIEATNVDSLGIQTARKMNVSRVDNVTFSGTTIVVPKGASKTENRRTGGYIDGSGHGDIVPAMLEPGEFVIPKSVVEVLGTSFFEKLRNKDYVSTLSKEHDNKLGMNLFNSVYDTNYGDGNIFSSSENLVKGTGLGDIVPANLTSGDFVIPRSKVNALGTDFFKPLQSVEIAKALKQSGKSGLSNAKPSKFANGGTVAGSPVMGHSARAIDISSVKPSTITVDVEVAVAKRDASETDRAIAAAKELESAGTSLSSGSDKFSKAVDIASGTLGSNTTDKSPIASVYNSNITQHNLAMARGGRANDSLSMDKNSISALKTQKPVIDPSFADSAFAFVNTGLKKVFQRVDNYRNVAKKSDCLTTKSVEKAFVVCADANSASKNSKSASETAVKAIKSAGISTEKAAKVIGASVSKTTPIVPKHPVVPSVPVKAGSRNASVSNSTYDNVPKAAEAIASSMSNAADVVTKSADVLNAVIVTVPDTAGTNAPTIDNTASKEIKAAGESNKKEKFAINFNSIAKQIKSIGSYYDQFTKEVKSSFPILKQLSKAMFETFGTTMVNSIKKISDGITNLFSDIIPAMFSSFVQDVLISNASVVSDFQNTMNDMNNAQESGLAALVEQLKRNEISYFDYFNKLEDLESNSTDARANAQQDMLNKMDDNLKKFISSFTKKMAEMIKGVATGFKDMAEKALGGITSIMNKIASITENVVAGISGAFGTVIDLVAGTTEAATSAVTTIAAAGASAAAGGTGAVAGGGVAAALGGTATVATGGAALPIAAVGIAVGSLIGASLGDAISSVFPIIDQLGNAFMDVTTGMFNGIMSLIPPLMDLATMSEQDFASVFGGSYQGTDANGQQTTLQVSNAESVIGMLPQEINKVSQQLIDRLGQITTLLGNSLGDIVNNFLDNAPNIADALMNTLVSLAPVVYTVMSNAIIRLASMVPGIVRSVFTGLNSVAQSLIDSINMDAVSNSISDMVKNLASSIKEFLPSIISSVFKIISEISKASVEIGIQLISGIVSVMSDPSVQAAVLSGMKELVGVMFNALRDALKSVFPFVGALVDGLAVFASAIASAGAYIVVVNTATTAFVVLLSSLTTIIPPLLLILSVIVPLLFAFGKAIQFISAQVKSAFDKISSDTRIKEFADSLFKALDKLGKSIGELLGAVTGTDASAIDNVVTFIVGFVKAASAMIPVLTTMVSITTKAVKAMTYIANSIWSFVNSITKAITGLFNFDPSIIDDLVNNVISLGQAVLDARVMFEPFAAIFAKIGDILAGAYSLIEPYISKMQEFAGWFYNVISLIVSALVNMPLQSFAVSIGIIAKHLNAYTKFYNEFKQAAAGDEKLQNSLKEFETARKAIGGALSHISDAFTRIKKALDKVFTAFKKVFEALGINLAPPDTASSQGQGGPSDRELQVNDSANKINTLIDVFTSLLNVLTVLADVLVIVSNKISMFASGVAFLIELIAMVYTAWFNTIANIINEIKYVALGIYMTFKPVIDFFTGVGAQILGFFAGIMQSIETEITKAINNLTSIITKWADDIAKLFSDPLGISTATNGNTDTGTSNSQNSGSSDPIGNFLKLFGVYHQGGVFAPAMPGTNFGFKADEGLAVLQAGELILNKQQAEGIANFSQFERQSNALDFVSSISKDVARSESEQRTQRLMSGKKESDTATVQSYEPTVTQGAGNTVENKTVTLNLTLDMKDSTFVGEDDMTGQIESQIAENIRNRKGELYDEIDDLKKHL